MYENDDNLKIINGFICSRFHEDADDFVSKEKLSYSWQIIIQKCFFFIVL